MRIDGALKMHLIHYASLTYILVFIHIFSKLLVRWSEEDEPIHYRNPIKMYLGLSTIRNDFVL